MHDYEVEKVPKLIVEETYDTTSSKLRDQYRIHEYKESGFKLDQMKEFLRPFARLTPKEELEEASENKEQQKSESESTGSHGSNFKEVTERLFNKQVL